MLIRSDQSINLLIQEIKNNSTQNGFVIDFSKVRLKQFYAEDYELLFEKLKDCHLSSVLFSWRYLSELLSVEDQNSSPHLLHFLKQLNIKSIILTDHLYFNQSTEEEWKKFFQLFKAGNMSALTIFEANKFRLQPPAWLIFFTELTKAETLTHLDLSEFKVDSLSNSLFMRFCLAIKNSNLENLNIKGIRLKTLNSVQINLLELAIFRHTPLLTHAWFNFCQQLERSCIIGDERITQEPPIIDYKQKLIEFYNMKLLQRLFIWSVPTRSNLRTSPHRNRADELLERDEAVQTLKGARNVD